MKKTILLIGILLLIMTIVGCSHNRQSDQAATYGTIDADSFMSVIKEEKRAGSSIQSEEWRVFFPTMSFRMLKLFPCLRIIKV